MSTVSSQSFLDWYRRGDIALHHTSPLEEILAWPDWKLEAVHDYIQWIFPLPEESIFADAVPVVDETVFARFRSEARLREQLERAFVRISKFYGFSVQDNLLTRDFSRPEEAKWVRSMDHNHLRITRIIRSLRVLGLPRRARAFHEALLQADHDFRGKIGRRSIMYWTRAMERPLYIAPHEKDDCDSGPAFLVDFEQKAGNAHEN